MSTEQLDKMEIGQPGKYGDECAAIREKYEAEVACLMIGGGILGSGFSVEIAALDGERADAAARKTAGLLREVADAIDRTLADPGHKWTS